MATLNPAITLENLTSVLSNMVFNQHNIKLTQRTGNIKIEIEPARTINNGFATLTIPATHYTLGYTPEIGYWLRRQGESGSTFPLHYDRYTGKYGFETFEEAANHLEKLFVKKYL